MHRFEKLKLWHPSGDTLNSVHDLARSSLIVFFCRYSRGRRKGGFWAVRAKVDAESSFAEVKRWGIEKARYGTVMGHGGGRWGGWWVRYASGVPAEQVAILGQGGHRVGLKTAGEGMVRDPRGL